ncbi:MAG: FtsB family cell division protein [Hyphomicrobium sp.]
MQNSRHKVRQILVLLFCLGVTAYFSYHTVYGRYGLEARTQLKERLQALKVEIASLETVRSKLQNDVSLLSVENPNPVIIEEVAGEVIGFVYPQDKVILFPKDR